MNYSVYSAYNESKPLELRGLPPVIDVILNDAICLFAYVKLKIKYL